MGFQRRGSGSRRGLLSGWPAFLGAARGEPAAHFHACRILPPLCRAGPRGERGWQRTKPHSSPETASSRTSRGRRWAGSGTPSISRLGSAAPPAHRAVMQGAPGCGTQASMEGERLCRDRRTLRLFSREIPCPRRLLESEDVSFHLPLPHSRPPGWYGPSSPVVKGLCFSSVASAVPTKGSLPDFCVSSIQCLQSSSPLVVTKYIIARLIHKIFQNSNTPSG